MKTVALILARGGSKGIPRKNIKMLAGKALIEWSIQCALHSRLLDTVVVSTEDAEIADVARRAGAQVPFLRPPELAEDDTPSIDAVLHALDRLPGYDAVLLLQPTSPLRSTEDVDGCISLANSLKAPAAISVTEVEKHPYWMYSLAADQRLQALIDSPPVSRRQALPPVYAINGAIYFAHTGWLSTHCSFIAAETVAYVMPPERSVDIDTSLDWKLAELLLKERC